MLERLLLYRSSSKAAQPNANIVTLDFSLQMLEEARIKAEADETDLFLVRADGRICHSLVTLLTLL